jgi:DNA-directed RNA polymerase specialized sigma24 family protein
MFAGTLDLDSFRENLLRAIAEVIQSWPDLPRRIFMQVHYRGRSVEDVARSSGLSACEVRQILDCYERKLRAALRPFRMPQQSAAFVGNLSCAIPSPRQ